MTRTRSFTESAILPTTPERAFWSTIAPDALPKGDPHVEYWEPDELPPRLGTTNTMKLTTVLGVKLKVRSRFTEFEPPHRMMVQGVRPFFSPWTRLTYEIEPVEEDRVSYTVTTEITAPTWAVPIAALMERVLRQRVRAAVAFTARRFGGEAIHRDVEYAPDPPGNEEDP